ncbi:MAG TPA: YerC/YecD family TrpR-related protein [Blastocatellia bacterium]|nr:YerC/YecD family TrpR-related protein [Blastocatellia bacterium]
MRKVARRDIESLYEAILSLEDLGEAKMFFRDLLTEREIEELAERWKAARLLAEGVPYTQIVERTGLSSTTVARVARWMKQGAGGYRLALKRQGIGGA